MKKISFLSKKTNHKFEQLNDEIKKRKTNIQTFSKHEKRLRVLKFT